MQMDEPTSAPVMARLQRCVTGGNEMVAARVRMWSDQDILAPGSPFRRRLRYPASSAARAMWFEQISDLKKSTHMWANFERQMAAIERDIRAEVGSRVELVAVGRTYGDESILTPAAAARGGYIVRAFNPNRVGAG